MCIRDRDEFNSLSLVPGGLFLLYLEDDLNKNAIVDTLMEENPSFFCTLREDDQNKIIKVILDNRESSGSAIHFSL